MIKTTSPSFIPLILSAQSTQDAEKYLEAFLQHSPYAFQHGIVSYVKNHTVYWHHSEQTSFGIEDVRQLHTQLAYAQTNLQVHVILHADQITLPAQHALLKLLEEPPAWCLLVLVCTHQESLLETIQSRCHYIKEGMLIKEKITPSAHEVKNLYQKLLSASIVDCITIAEMHKDVTQAKQLMQQMLTHLHNLLIITPTQQYTQHLRCITQTHQALEANSNVQLTLEHCFFTIAGHIHPKISSFT